MKSHMKILIAVGVVLSLMMAEAYILKKDNTASTASLDNGSFLVPSALAQTTGSSLTLSRPSCTNINSVNGGTFGNSFACMGDLRGDGRESVIVGNQTNGCGVDIPGIGWCFTILNPDGTKTVVR